MESSYTIRLKSNECGCLSKGKRLFYARYNKKRELGAPNSLFAFEKNQLFFVKVSVALSLVKESTVNTYAIFSPPSVAVLPERRSPALNT